jgi:hypothetical protein
MSDVPSGESSPLFWLHSYEILVPMRGVEE